MKIIIAGMGTTGNYLAQVLQKEKHDLILIESDSKKYKFAQEHFDAQIQLGDACDPTILEPLVDETVDLFIALTRNDGSNIVATLIARKFGASRAIARISDSNNLIHPLLTDDPNVSLLNSEMIVSKDLTRMISTPSADEIEFFAKGKAEMVTLHVGDESEILNNKLKNIKIPSSWLVVATIRKGTFEICSGETEFLPGDQVLVVGDPKKYGEIEHLVGLKSKKVRRVILIGYSEVSYRLAQTLHSKGIEVRLIEDKKESAEEAAGKLDDILVLHGDGTDEEILDQAGVEETDYLIALTDDDETNVLISLLAKEKGVERVVTLIQKPHYKRIIHKIGIDSVITPRSSMVDEVIHCIHHKDVLGINILGEGQGRMMELIVNKKTHVIGKALSKIKLPTQILIGAIIRHDQLIIPRGNTQIQVGDHVVVFSTMSEITEVKKLFGA